MQSQAIQIETTAGQTAYLPRVDVYGTVHKGLRSALCSVLAGLGRCDAGDAAAVQQAVDDLEGMLYMCTTHAEHEDAVIIPAIEAARAGAAAKLSATHEQQERDIAAMRAMAAELSSAGVAQRPALLRQLHLRYAAFTGANLVHMTEEEEFALPLLEAAYTSAEIEAMMARIRGALGPEESFAFMRVMLPAIAPAERALLLAGLRRGMPLAVRRTLAGMLRSQLPAGEIAALEAQ
jgi:iron-sulfur cluster repair protein YtfE (RIC family)